RTFNWIPHCWPQKQQWVLTSFSGSTLVESRMPVISERCGPNCRVMFRSSTGGVAMGCSIRFRRTLVQSFPPHRPLRQAKQCAAALGADLLIMLDAWPIHLVTESELFLDDSQIANHHRRCEWLTASLALRLLRSFARILVETHAELCRPLEEMEELAER